MMDDDDDLVFVCIECGHGCTSYEDLNDHMEEHLDQKPFSQLSKQPEPEKYVFRDAVDGIKEEEASSYMLESKKYPAYIVRGHDQPVGNNNPLSKTKDIAKSGSKKIAKKRKKKTGIKWPKPSISIYSKPNKKPPNYVPKPRMRNKRGKFTRRPPNQHLNFFKKKKSPETEEAGKDNTSEKDANNAKDEGNDAAEEAPPIAYRTRRTKEKLLKSMFLEATSHKTRSVSKMRQNATSQRRSNRGELESESDDEPLAVIAKKAKEATLNRKKKTLEAVNSKRKVKKKKKNFQNTPITDAYTLKQSLKSLHEKLFPQSGTSSKLSTDCDPPLLSLECTETLETMLIESSTSHDHRYSVNFKSFDTNKTTRPPSPLTTWTSSFAPRPAEKDNDSKSGRKLGAPPLIIRRSSGQPRPTANLPTSRSDTTNKQGQNESTLIALTKSSKENISGLNHSDTGTKVENNSEGPSDFKFTFMDQEIRIDFTDDQKVVVTMGDNDQDKGCTSKALPAAVLERNKGDVSTVSPGTLSTNENLPSKSVRNGKLAQESEQNKMFQHSSASTSSGLPAQNKETSPSSLTTNSTDSPKITILKIPKSSILPVSSLSPVVLSAPGQTTNTPKWNLLKIPTAPSLTSTHSGLTPSSIRATNSKNVTLLNIPDTLLSTVLRQKLASAPTLPASGPSMLKVTPIKVGTTASVPSATLPGIRYAPSAIKQPPAVSGVTQFIQVKSPTGIVFSMPHTAVTLSRAIPTTFPASSQSIKLLSSPVMTSMKKPDNPSLSPSSVLLVPKVPVTLTSVQKANACPKISVSAPFIANSQKVAITSPSVTLPQVPISTEQNKVNTAVSSTLPASVPQLTLNKQLLQLLESSSPLSTVSTLSNILDPSSLSKQLNSVLQSVDTRGATTCTVNDKVRPNVSILPAAKSSTDQVAHVPRLSAQPSCVSSKSVLPSGNTQSSSSIVKMAVPCSLSNFLQPSIGTVVENPPPRAGEVATSSFPELPKSNVGLSLSADDQKPAMKANSSSIAEANVNGGSLSKSVVYKNFQSRALNNAKIATSLHTVSQGVPSVTSTLVPQVENKFVKSELQNSRNVPKAASGAAVFSCASSISPEHVDPESQLQATALSGISRSGSGAIKIATVPFIGPDNVLQSPASTGLLDVPPQGNSASKTESTSKTITTSADSNILRNMVKLQVSFPVAPLNRPSKKTKLDSSFVLGFECDHCGVAYPSYEEMIVHRAAHSTAFLSRPICPRFVVCRWCGKWMQSTTDLEKHLLTECNADKSGDSALKVQSDKTVTPIKFVPSPPKSPKAHTPNILRKSESIQNGSSKPRVGPIKTVTTLSGLRKANNERRSSFPPSFILPKGAITDRHDIEERLKTTDDGDTDLVTVGKSAISADVPQKKKKKRSRSSDIDYRIPRKKNKTFNCEPCDEIFSSYAELEEHNSNVHGATRYNFRTRKGFSSSVFMDDSEGESDFESFLPTFEEKDVDYEFPGEEIIDYNEL